MFSTASLMILLLFNLMIFRNTVKCHQIESVNEKLNTTEENCQDGICKEIIDYKSSLDSSDISSNDSPIFRNIEENETFDLSIPENTPCEELPVECINCQFDLNCLYGHSLNVTCKAKSTVKCKSPRHFEKTMICRYCYQTSRDEHSCSDMSHCNSAANPVQRYRSNCTTKSHVLCLGRRSFLKNIRCNWTAGYRWSTTLFLSVTLGGFGADRFYLGHWQEGIGKLFSFGGAGVWTLIDVILVAIGYLKPADGSLYI